MIFAASIIAGAITAAIAFALGMDEALVPVVGVVAAGLAWLETR